MADIKKSHLWIKTFVLATSFFPIKQCYIGIYKLVAWWTAKEVYKDPFVTAVYLRGGCSRGETVPGISDIDLIVFVDTEAALIPDAPWDWDLARNFATRYNPIARRIPILEAPGAMRPRFTARLEDLYLLGYQDRYMGLEIKQTGELLRGRDCLARLDEMPPLIQLDSKLNQVEVRWAVFVAKYLRGPKFSGHLSGINSTCYRLCSDILRFSRDVLEGTQTVKRGGALTAALSHLEGADRAYAKRLIKLEKRNFLGRDAALIEDCNGFMLRQYHRFYGRLDGQPCSDPLVEGEQLIDAPIEECLHSAAVLHHASHILDHLEQNWTTILQGVYLVPSFFYGVEDLLLLIEVDPDNLPSVSQLSALIQTHCNQPTDLPQNMHLFLLLPNCACYLGKEVLFDYGWHPIMAAALVPDAFTLLQQPEFTLRRGDYPQRSQAAFNLQCGYYVWSQKLRWRQHLEAWPATKPADTRFLSYFWKSLQVLVTERSVGNGQIRYPLTLGAIQRGLETMAAPLPAGLKPLVSAYRQALAGQSDDSVVDVPGAKDYLRHIDPEGHQLKEVPAWLALPGPSSSPTSTGAST